MVIRVQCACGQSIKTADKNAGKLARCPACRELVPLPGGNADRPLGVAQLADGTVCLQVMCPCGRVIRTSLDNAGKAARCPECGEVIPLPKIRKETSSTGSSGQHRRASQNPVAAAGDLDFPDFSSPHGDVIDDQELDWNDLPEPEVAAPARPKRPKKKTPQVQKDAEDSETIEVSPKKNGDSGEGSQAMLIVGGIIGLVVAIGLLVGVFVFVLPAIDQQAKLAAEADAQPGVLPPDLKFTNFKDDNVHLRFEYPEGWKSRASGGSSGVPPVAILEDGSARVEFRVNQAGSAVSMIMQPNGPDPNERNEEFSAAARIHDMNRKRYEEDISGYTEIGSPRTIKIQGFGGEARVSDFTANQGLWGKVRGYRVTLVGGDQWNCFLQCPYGQWKKYQPIFDKILEHAHGG